MAVDHEEEQRGLTETLLVNKVGGGEENERIREEENKGTREERTREEKRKEEGCVKR